MWVTLSKYPGKTVEGLEGDPSAFFVEDRSMSWQIASKVVPEASRSVLTSTVANVTHFESSIGGSGTDPTGMNPSSIS